MPVYEEEARKYSGQLKLLLVKWIYLQYNRWEGKKKPVCGHFVVQTVANHVFN